MRKFARARCAFVDGRRKKHTKRQQQHTDDIFLSRSHGITFSLSCLLAVAESRATTRKCFHEILVCFKIFTNSLFGLLRWLCNVWRHKLSVHFPPPVEWWGKPPNSFLLGLKRASKRRKSSHGTKKAFHISPTKGTANNKLNGKFSSPTFPFKHTKFTSLKVSLYLHGTTSWYISKQRRDTRHFLRPPKSFRLASDDVKEWMRNGKFEV